MINLMKEHLEAIHYYETSAQIAVLAGRIATCHLDRWRIFVSSDETPIRCERQTGDSVVASVEGGVDHQRNDEQ